MHQPIDAAFMQWAWHSCHEACSCVSCTASLVMCNTDYRCHMMSGSCTTVSSGSFSQYCLLLSNCKSYFQTSFDSVVLFTVLLRMVRMQSRVHRWSPASLLIHCSHFLLRQELQLEILTNLQQRNLHHVVLHWSAVLLWHSHTRPALEQMPNMFLQFVCNRVHLETSSHEYTDLKMSSMSRE